MSIESGPRQYHEGDERRGDDAASMPDKAPTYNVPPRPDQDPESLSGQFDIGASYPEGSSGWLRSGRLRLLAAVAAGGTLIGGGIFLGLSGEKEGLDTETKEPGVSAPAIPGAAETNTGETNFKTKADYAPTVYDTALFKELTPGQQDEVTKFEEMSYDIFRRLPNNDELAYSDFYYSAYKDYGMEQVKRSPYYQKDTPEVVNEASTGQDILNDFAARQGAIFYTLAEKGDPYNISPTNPNREEAKKALSLIYADKLSDSKIRTIRAEQLTNLENLEADETSQYNGDGYPVRKADRESEVGVELGKTTKRINVKDPSGEYDQYVFNYTSFTDIQGQEQSVWQLNVILGEEDPRYAPDVENAY